VTAEIHRRLSEAEQIGVYRRLAGGGELQEAKHRGVGRYDSGVTRPQTGAVELSADLAQRAEREAERRGIALRQLVEDALRHFLAREEQESQSQQAGPDSGWEGRPTP